MGVRIPWLVTYETWLQKNALRALIRNTFHISPMFFLPVPFPPVVVVSAIVYYILKLPDVVVIASPQKYRYIVKSFLFEAIEVLI